MRVAACILFRTVGNIGRGVSRVTPQKGPNVPRYAADEAQLDGSRPCMQWVDQGSSQWVDWQSIVMSLKKGLEGFANDSDSASMVNATRTRKLRYITSKKYFFEIKSLPLVAPQPTHSRPP